MKKYFIILIIIIFLFFIIEPIIISIANIQHENTINKNVEEDFYNLDIPDEEKIYINMDYLKDDIRAFYNGDKFHAIITENSPKNNKWVREVYVGEGYRLEKEDACDATIYSIVSVKTNKVFGTIVKGTGTFGGIYGRASSLIIVIRTLIVWIGIILILRLFVMTLKNKKYNIKL